MTPYKFRISKACYNLAVNFRTHKMAAETSIRMGYAASVAEFDALVYEEKVLMGLVPAPRKKK